MLDVESVTAFFIIVTVVHQKVKEQNHLDVAVQMHLPIFVAKILITMKLETQETSHPLVQS
jgi:hypothetical protein